MEGERGGRGGEKEREAERGGEEVKGKVGYEEEEIKGKSRRRKEEIIYNNVHLFRIVSPP